ncbi:hypothetical protein [Bradyrhizobium genosp. P]|uniref:hypothetical protein n=1 Tax=Bradyrhizobium genosp. P TaxID=83641 RepID=UPI003CF62F00
MELFDHYGRLRTDFQDSEITALTEEQRGCFAELISAGLKNQEDEDELVAARKALPVALRALDAAQKADRLAQPQVTFTDALYAVLAAQRKSAGLPPI